MVRIQKGSPVRVKLAGQYWNGIVTEERGSLGPSSSELFRVRLNEPEGDGAEFDVPASWLEISPPSSGSLLGFPFPEIGSTKPPH
jgi:hypothetical protein